MKTSAATQTQNSIRPQAGPQTVFLASPADIAIYGGSAASGKSFALLMETLRHIDNPRYGAVIFRRTSPQLRNEGGLWDTSLELYPHVSGIPKESVLEWNFPSGARVSFRHMEHEASRFDWYGAQIPLIGFDELITFTEKQFWFLVSRNRSTCGVAPYMRATTNPAPDSWVAELIAWWIDQETGYAIPERAGVVRWFMRVNDELQWFDSRKAALAYVMQKNLDRNLTPKSLSFIPATIYDNQKLLEKDPGYLANLMALPYVERMQLLGDKDLGGNWKVSPKSGGRFDKDWFEIVDAIRGSVVKRIRYWDKAGTEGGGKWSAGVLMAQTANNQFFIEDVVRGQWGALKREETIKNVASQDGPQVEIWTEQEPGSGGKESAEATVRNLAGYVIKLDRVTGSKWTRSGPYAAQAEAGNVKLLRGEWNKAFLNEHHNFSSAADTGSIVCDQVDASSGAFNQLAGQKRARAY